MSPDHPADFYGSVLPNARPRRRPLRMLDSPAEGATRAAPQIAAAVFRQPSITAQALDIIETVLADSDPSLADIQRRLRRNVANHPGNPNRALLAHLLEIRRGPTSGA
jgi:hypothetical protein